MADLIVAGVRNVEIQKKLMAMGPTSPQQLVKVVAQLERDLGLRTPGNILLEFLSYTNNILYSGSACHQDLSR